MTLMIAVNLPYNSNIPRDVAINTFVVDGETEENSPAIVEAIDAYYNTAADGATHQLNWYLSAVINETLCHMEVSTINLATGELTPVNDIPMPIAASPNTSSFPLEVALCSSFQSGADFGTPSVRRRRGRHYLGPFHVGVAGASVDAVPRPIDILVEDMTLAAVELQSALETNGTPWCVWSRAEADVFPIDRGWVDYAWDTQRRREVDTISRATWTSIVP